MKFSRLQGKDKAKSTINNCKPAIKVARIHESKCLSMPMSEILSNSPNLEYSSNGIKEKSLLLLTYTMQKISNFSKTTEFIFFL